MGRSLSKEFDYPDRYEREKITRIMPDALRQLGYYTLRMMWPPETPPPFASEFLAVIIESEQRESDYWDVGFVWQPVSEPEPTDAVFNPDGFMVVGDTVSESGNEGQEEEIEIGYFVGSTDPYDLELAEMIANAKELVATK